MARTEDLDEGEKVRRIRRLFWDIEVSPGVFWAWRPGYNINLSYKNQLREAAVICISWMWEGTNKVHHLQWDSKQCDKEMLRKFIIVLEQADEICGHNADAFDLRWVRTRAIKHGLAMSPDFVSYDTWKLAKAAFRFDSASLDYISKYLNVAQKKETGGSQLWVDVVFNKDKKALKKMVAYCDGDVISQAAVFTRMKPYIKSKANYADYISDCPECGSEKVTITKRRKTAAGHQKIQFVCAECGRYHTVAASRFDKDAKI
jgi:DNA-directed RNA polymerase subunit M/transcription elongation factor TFIIS